MKINGAWLNFSKFAAVAPPEAGQTVAVTVRGDRWVQGLRILGPGGLDELEGAAGPDVGEAPPADDDDPGTWGYGSGKGSAAPRPVRQAAPSPTVRPQPAATPAAPVPAPAPVRSRESVRATCVLAAATWSQGRTDVDAQDLVGIAELLYTWASDKED